MSIKSIKIELVKGRLELVLCSIFLKMAPNVTGTVAKQPSENTVE